MSQSDPSAERLVRRELQSLFELAPIGAVRINMTASCTVLLNREAERIAGLVAGPAGRLSGTELQDLSCRRHDGTTVRLGELCRELAGAETVQSEEVEFLTAGECNVNALVGTAGVADDGESGTMVLTVQDLTPFDRLDRIRSQFMAAVAHDLRAPLTAIRGAADTLLADGNDLDRTEMREFFRIVAGQANHMRKLVSDLLDRGSIEAGTLSISLERCQPGKLVEQARVLFEQGDGRHPLHIDLPPDLPPVMADYRRIVQVLGNLLANAARHAPDHTPITVAAVRDGQHVAMSVSDQGTGIAPERLPELFRRHRRLADGRAAGTGLGLAICKGLVEAHGGRIRADSAGTGRGATFTFTLPVAEVPDSRAGAAGEPAQPAPAPRDPARVLVVDDDPLALRFARDTLQADGHTVIQTGDPGDLPHLLRTERPHLTLLDLALSGTDAIELMQQLPGLAGVPVIIISGYSRQETIAKALDAGAEDYIVKPCSKTELAARVRLVLRRSRQPGTFVSGRLAIDYGRRSVSINGQAVVLTATEYDLLGALARNSGKVVTYDQLMRQVWLRGEADPNLVRMHVSNLRRKLGDRGEKPVWIFNERAVGYRMAGPDDSGQQH